MLAQEFIHQEIKHQEMIHWEIMRDLFGVLGGDGGGKAGQQ